MCGGINPTVAGDGCGEADESVMSPLEGAWEGEILADGEMLSMIVEVHPRGVSYGLLLLFRSRRVDTCIAVPPASIDVGGLAEAASRRAGRCGFTRQERPERESKDLRGCEGQGARRAVGRNSLDLIPESPRVAEGSDPEVEATRLWALMRVSLHPL